MFIINPGRQRDAAFRGSQPPCSEKSDSVVLVSAEEKLARQRLDGADEIWRVGCGCVNVWGWWWGGWYVTGM